MEAPASSPINSTLNSSKKRKASSSASTISAANDNNNNDNGKRFNLATSGISHDVNYFMSDAGTAAAVSVANMNMSGSDDDDSSHEERACTIRRIDDGDSLAPSDRHTVAVSGKLPPVFDAGSWDSEANSRGDEEDDDDNDTDTDTGSSLGEGTYSDSDFDSSDDEDDIFLFDREETVELCEKVLLQVKQNDPTVTSLTLNSFVCLFNIAQLIGDNTHIKKLIINGEYVDWKGDLSVLHRHEKFCTGVAGNRFIEHFILNECCLSGGAALPTITSLSPFVEHNVNLKSLEVTKCSMGDDSTRLLTSALSRRDNKSSLQRISLDANAISDEMGGKLIHALQEYGNLEELTLGDNEIGARGCGALMEMLSSSTARMKVLNLYNNVIDDTGIASLTDALTKNTTLTDLNLSFNGRISETGWQTFSCCLKSPNSAIEKLNLSSNNITDVGADALGDALLNNSTLKVLSLCDLSSDRMPFISYNGWRNFFTCLRHDASALEEIDLRYISFDSQGLYEVANAISRNTTVKALDLSHNAQVPAAGWRSFFACLQGSSHVLKELRVCDNNITNTEMTYVSNAIVGNMTLEMLDLSECHSISKEGWAHVARVLCDASSLDAICTSNHSLTSLGPDYLPEEVEELMQMNQSMDKAAVAREKLLQYHFRDERTNHLQEFFDMEMCMLPHAISWIGRDGIGATLQYQLLRSTPSLFTLESKTKVKYWCKEEV